MRILLLCDHYGVGGGAGQIAKVQARQLALKHVVEVLTAHSSQESESGIRVHTFNLNYSKYFKNYMGIYHPSAVRILREHLRSNKYDTCYVHNLHTYWSYACLKVLKDFGVRTVLTFHDVAAVTPYVKFCRIPYQKTEQGYQFDYRYSWRRHFWEAKLTYNPVRNFMIRNYLKLADEKIAVSRALAEFLKTNDINVDRVEHNKLQPFDTAPSTDYGDTILFGGRLSTPKGALLTVRYLDHLKKEYSITPKLLIAGHEGVVTEKMKVIATELGVIEQIVFLGWLDQKQYEKILGECGLVIVPSICFDSFPTVILEAMRRARPVVATIFGGSAEMVIEGETGYIADPNDIEKFTGAIAEILINKVLAKNLGTAGYKRFNQMFVYDSYSG